MAAESPKLPIKSDLSHKFIKCVTRTNTILLQYNIWL